MIKSIQMNVHGMREVHHFFAYMYLHVLDSTRNNSLWLRFWPRPRIRFGRGFGIRDKSKWFRPWFPKFVSKAIGIELGFQIIIQLSLRCNGICDSYVAADPSEFEFDRIGKFDVTEPYFFSKFEH